MWGYFTFCIIAVRIFDLHKERMDNSEAYRYIFQMRAMMPNHSPEPNPMSV